ncbi:MAG TPA: hypothetical protein PLH71_03760 [Clostridia bacterium]|nr:hypothetical protein [Clostridia bacterium]
MRKNIVRIGILIFVLAFCIITLASKPADKVMLLYEDERLQPEQVTVANPVTTVAIKGAWENAVSIYGGISNILAFNDSFSEKWYLLESMPEGKSITLMISCDDPAVTGVVSALYYKDDVITLGNNAERLFGTYALNKPSVYKIKKEGSYYLKVSVIGNSAVGSEIKLNYTITQNDIYEDNDIWEKATAIDIKQAYQIDISAVNDIDWFKITLQKDQSLQYMIKNGISTGGDVNVSVYREEDLIKYGDTASVILTSSDLNKYFTYKTDNAQTYFLKVTASVRGAVINKVTLMADIIEPDSLEGNDSYDKAIMLDAGIIRSLTISASNDVDWFMVKTDKPGQTIRFNIRNSSSSGSKLVFKLYEASQLIANSETAEATYTAKGARTSYVYVDEAGTYYLKLYTEDNSVITSPVEISYTVIPADQHEPNNEYQRAKDISGNSETSFTLPALNDQDWFIIKTRKDYLGLRLNTYIPKTGATVNIDVYRQDDLESYGDTEPLFSFNSSQAPYIYMLEEKGIYYIKITSDTIISDECKLQHSLLDSDSNEPNNSKETAGDFKPGETKTFTISGINDEDWFCINIEKDNSVIEYMLKADYNKYAKVSLYSETELTSYEEYAVPLFTSSKYDELVAYKFEKAGIYYIKINSSLPILDKTYIEYSIKESDVHENNDTWDKATAIKANEEINFTIKASNDADWFKITNDSMNKMSLSFTVDTKYLLKDTINVYVYREIDLLNYGSRAQHICLARTSDLSNILDISEGTYYIKAVSVNDAAFDHEFTLKANIFMMQD